MSGLKIGVRFPDYEVPIEGGVVRAFAEAAEDLGYDHITTFDHIAGMTEATRRNWKPLYTTKDLFGETFIMIAWMAAATKRIGFMPDILVLPLRPTALVAKQFGTLDLLSNGRMRLGVGLGWNDIEYELFNVSFDDRGERIEEQIELLRAFWSQEAVSLRGKFHRVRAVGMAPLPVQQPIPIWMAPGDFATSKRALRRAARLADGILPMWAADAQAPERLDVFFDAVREAGRDPSTIGVEGHLDLGRADVPAGASRLLVAPTLEPKSDEELATELRAWVELDRVTHLEFKTRECELPDLDAHIKELARFREIVRAVTGE